MRWNVAPLWPVNVIVWTSMWRTFERCERELEDLADLVLVHAAGHHRDQRAVDAVLVEQLAGT